METILSGRFDAWGKAEYSAQALLNIARMSKQDICTFYAGPAAVATGAVVGAYTGSLQGMDDETDNPHPSDLPTRASGVIVAIRVEEPCNAEDRVVQSLERAGAQDIEKTEGAMAQWRMGGF
ncbi:hypothetical protein [Sulfuriferula multivorans]|uniref:hypothetical protein n=1 Tax=Sulfuriferula multivorans TaxID=1559896 RepID=UPI000F5B8A71|nr:hypothetical protein [Sulfuriferula multivorans]